MSEDIRLHHFDTCCRLMLYDIPSNAQSSVQTMGLLRTQNNKKFQQRSEQKENIKKHLQGVFEYSSHNLEGAARF